MISPGRFACGAAASAAMRRVAARFAAICTEHGLTAGGRRGGGPTQCAVTLIATAFIALAPIAMAQAPPPAPPRPINWPVINESKLDNGLTVVLVPLHNVPKITAELSVLAGRGTAYKTQPGVAQLAARVANEGTATRTSLQIKQELRSIGGSLTTGVDNDATTLTASSLADFAPKLLDLVSDVARHPSYPQSEVALAKTNFVQEIEE